MKKVLAILLALAMVLALTACGETKEENLPEYSQGLTKDGFYDLKASDYVKLPDYKGIELPEDVKTVDQNDVLEQLNSLTVYYATTKQVKDRAVEKGDTVNIAYTGRVDGEEFSGGTTTGTDVVAGGTNYIDDFLDQIIGHMPGETFDVNVTFPVPYPNNPDIAGKDAVFETTINYIEETEEPELTDEFIRTNYSGYGVKTVEEMRQYIENDLLHSQKMSYIDQYLLDNSTYDEIPEVVLEHQKKLVRLNYEAQAAQYGLDVEQLLQAYGMSSFDELMEASADTLKEMSADVLLYQAIAEAEGIKIKNTDVADYFEQMTGSRDYSSYQNVYGLPYLKLLTMTYKAVDAVINNAK